MKRYIFQIKFIIALSFSLVYASDVDILMGGSGPQMSLRTLLTDMKHGESDQVLIDLVPGVNRQVISEASISSADVIARLSLTDASPCWFEHLPGFLVCVSYVLKNKEPEAFALRDSSLIVLETQTSLKENPTVTYVHPVQTAIVDLSPTLMGHFLRPSIASLNSQQAIVLLSIPHLMQAYERFKEDFLTRAPL